MRIHYRFDLDNGPMHEFTVDLDRAPASPRDAQGWTRLDHHRCRNCPLSAERHSHCPPAVDLEAVVDSFAEIISYETTTVTVETPERLIMKHCDVQTGLASLLGLIMASSGCPKLGQLRGMALTHLPFQSMEETASRFIGGWYLGQLLRQRAGQTPDWSLDGLNALFDELMVLNQDFKARIHSAARQDAAMNAVSALAAHTMDVQLSLEDCLDALPEHALPPFGGLS